MVGVSTQQNESVDVSKNISFEKNKQVINQG